MLSIKLINWNIIVWSLSSFPKVSCISYPGVVETTPLPQGVKFLFFSGVSSGGYRHAVSTNIKPSDLAAKKQKRLTTHKRYSPGSFNTQQYSILSDVFWSSYAQTCRPTMVKKIQQNPGKHSSSSSSSMGQFARGVPSDRNKSTLLASAHGWLRIGQNLHYVWKNAKRCAGLCSVWLHWRRQGREAVQLWHALQGVWTYEKNGAPVYATVMGALGFSHAWAWNWGWLPLRLLLMPLLEPAVWWENAWRLWRASQG